MKESSNIFDLEATDIDSKKRILNEFLPNNKAFIFVNVACFWALTSSNYTQLGVLYEKYSSKGLEIFCFPCNQFGAQEPNIETEIKKFVADGFGVKFQMFSKIEVNGPDTHPVYRFLKSNLPEMNLGNDTLKDIPWNFAKFLVDSNGKVIKFFMPKFAPQDMEDDILKLL